MHLTSIDIKHKNNEKIVPLPTKKNVLNEELVHKRRKRKNTKRQQVRELAIKKYDENGGAITILDLQACFRLTKAQAQSQIKHLHMEKYLFTADDLKKQSIVFKGKKRERPQKYYLTEMKAKIIEDNKNNVQNDTTGLSPIDNQKIQYLKDVLILISLVMLYIHNLQILVYVDKKYFDDLKDIKPAPINGAKTQSKNGLASGIFECEICLLSQRSRNDIRNVQRKSGSYP